MTRKLFFIFYFSQSWSFSFQVLSVLFMVILHGREGGEEGGVSVED